MVDIDIHRFIASATMLDAEIQSRSINLFPPSSSFWPYRPRSFRIAMFHVLGFKKLGLNAQFDQLCIHDIAVFRR